MIPGEEFGKAGRRAAGAIRKLGIWDLFGTVLLFMSMRNEIDTGPLIEAAMQEGKKIFLPRVVDGDVLCGDVSSSEECLRKIWFYGVTAEDFRNVEFWDRGDFGIREPPVGVPLMKRDFPALVFTPGLAFDKEGNRLGHGGGFYDRFFAGIKGWEFRAAGLCLNSQIVESVPVDERDYKMDFVYGF